MHKIVYRENTPKGEFIAFADAEEVIDSHMISIIKTSKYIPLKNFFSIVKRNKTVLLQHISEEKPLLQQYSYVRNQIRNIFGKVRVIPCTDLSRQIKYARYAESQVEVENDSRKSILRQAMLLMQYDYSLNKEFSFMHKLSSRIKKMTDKEKKNFFWYIEWGTGKPRAYACGSSMVEVIVPLTYVMRYFFRDKICFSKHPIFVYHRLVEAKYL